MDKKQVIIGFNVDAYDLRYLEVLTSKEKLELLQKQTEGVTKYDGGITSFFRDLNRNAIDIELTYWFIVEE